MLDVSFEATCLRNWPRGQPASSDSDGVENRHARRPDLGSPWHLLYRLWKKRSRFRAVYSAELLAKTATHMTRMSL